MKAARRQFLAGCAALPAIAIAGPIPLLAAPAARGAARVGEVWGLTFLARQAGHLPVIGRSALARRPRIVPAWHLEFA